MQAAVNNGVLIGLTTMAVSLALLFLLFQKHLAGQPLLPYEARRRIPWGLLPVALALFVPTLLTAALLPEGITPSETLQPEDFLVVGWLNSAVNIGFVLLATICLVTLLGADARDLGWPDSAACCGRDIGLGTVGCLAALLPIYLVNLVLVVLFESQERHPLVEQIYDTRSPEIVLVGMIMAVVAAPLYEEFTFRLLLQGWLEKVEDRFVGFHATGRESAGSESAVASENDAFFSVMADKRSAVERFSVTAAFDDATSTDDPAIVRPTHGMIGELPHGWAPILVSSVVFGLAHLGHGVAPVPLVLFGVVLGYMYQRTHRIVPCVVAHMLFNAYSLTVLWLSLEK